MNRYLTVFVLLWVVNTVKGAHFSYYAGGLRAFCEVYVKDSTSSDGPYSDTKDDVSSAGTSEYAEVTEAYSYADNSIWDANIPDINSVCIRAISYADMIADNASCSGFGYGYGGTEDSETYGIYYRIMPDEGEELGGEVIVYYNDTISISSYGTTFAYVGGPGDMDHMAITRGQLPPVVTEPNSENEVLAWANLKLWDEAGDWFSSVHTFPAQVGDVIGIFAENYTDVNDVGPSDSFIESDLWIVLTVEPVLAGDLDNDGKVDFCDFARFADNWLGGTP